MNTETLKVAELSGPLLDYWVAMAGEVWKTGHALFPTMTLDPTFKGVEMFAFSGGREVCRLIPNNPFRQDYQIYEPSTDWAIGGPLFEVAEIGSQKHGDNEWTATDWCAKNPHFYANGPTELIAKARCFVLMKYGDTVHVLPPEEGK